MKKICILLFILFTSCGISYGASLSGAKLTGAEMGVSAEEVCVAVYGSELAVTGNATDAGGVEASGVTDWGNGGFASIASGATPYAGSYALIATPDSAWDYFYRSLAAMSPIEGSLYKLSVYVRHGGAAAGTGNFSCYVGRSSDGNDCPMIHSWQLPKTATTWTYYDQYFDYGVAADYFVCYEHNDENDGTLYIDSLSLKQVTTICLGDELNVVADAATMGANESGVSSAWTVASTSGSPILAAVTTDPQDGTHHLHFDANGAPEGRFYRDMDGFLTVGKKYLVDFKFRNPSAEDTVVCGIWDATTLSTAMDRFQDRSQNDYAGWGNPRFSFTYYETQKFRYIGCIEVGLNENGEVDLDAISIKEIIE